MSLDSKPVNYLCRSAILNGFADTVSSLGGQPEVFLRRHGLPGNALSEQDLLLPTRDVLMLFEETARALEAEDFGLRLAQVRPFSTMGAISMAMREQTSIGDALASLADNIHIQAQGLSLALTVEGNLAFASTVIDGNVGGPQRQPAELTVAALCFLIREFLGSRWQPHTVLFMHKAPRSTQRHRVLFGAEPLFNCDRNALVMPDNVLTHPIANSDPVFAQQLGHFLSSIDQLDRKDTASTVRKLIMQLLPQGLASADVIATRLGIDRRTLHRKLSREGTTYRQLLQDMRCRQLNSLLESGNLQQQEIADRLGFLSASAFSRWKRSAAAELEDGAEGRT